MQYQINSRQYTALTPLANELIYKPNHNYLFELGYLSALQVQGDHAREFLQGQLSCDVRDINDHQMRKGILCDLKGRIQALLDVLEWKEHGFHLILPHDMLSLTKASLAKTAMFSRVILQQVNHYQLFGFHLQNDNDIIPLNFKLSNSAYNVTIQENCCCYSLGNNFYIILLKNDDAHLLREQFSMTLQLRGSLAWHALQIKQKRIEIYPESRGLFLPHRLDLHCLDYISFNKGCYKGQEIIARTHYRAKLKHELNIFYIHTHEALLSGKKIFDENGKLEIGELVDFCPIEKEKYLIAVSILLEHPQQARIEGHKEIVTLNQA